MVCGVVTQDIKEIIGKLMSHYSKLETRNTFSLEFISDDRKEEVIEIKDIEETVLESMRV